MELVDRSRFRLVLKCDVELDERIFESREFHRDTDEGMHDLRDISVRLYGITKLLLLRSG